MTKSDLKTGMIVTRRDGKKWTVYRNCACAFSHQIHDDVFVDASISSWEPFEYYTEDLLNKSGRTELDIMKIELVHHPYDFNKFPCNAKVDKILWVRDDTKKMTVAEIESILGYKVEIVSDK